MRKRRKRDVQKNPVRNWWDLDGNFVIQMGSLDRIWSFQNSRNFRIFIGIPQKVKEFRMFLVRSQNISILLLISVTAAAATAAVVGGAGGS